MTELQTDALAPVSPGRRPPASPLWLVGSAGLSAALAVVVGLRNVTPFYDLGARFGGPLFGFWAQLIVGLVLAGLILAIVWWFAVRGRRRETVTKYALGICAAWVVGVGAGALLTQGWDDRSRTDARPDSRVAEQRYWRARTGDLNEYLRARSRMMAEVEINGVNSRAQVVRARAQIGAVQRLLAQSRTRNTSNVEAARAGLAAMGRNEMERRAMLVDFNENSAEAEALITRFWALEARRLAGIEGQLAALQATGAQYTSHGAAFRFRSPADQQRYDAGVRETYAASRDLWSVMRDLDRVFGRVRRSPAGSTGEWIGLVDESGSGGR